MIVSWIGDVPAAWLGGILLCMTLHGVYRCARKAGYGWENMVHWVGVVEYLARYVSIMIL